MTGILWVDDEPQHVRPIIEVVKKHFANRSVQVDVDLVETFDEADERLSCDSEIERFDAAVFDLRLSESWSVEKSGAELARKHSRDHRTLPSFVYSAYLENDGYRGQLEEAYVVREGSKNTKLKEALQPGGFLSELVTRAEKYSSIKGLKPERIEFEAFMASPTAFELDVAAHWDRNEHWIEAEMLRQNLAWIVVCGDSVVSSGVVPDTFPDDDKLMDLGKNHSLLPFAYSVAHVPEMINRPEVPSGTTHWSGPLSWDNDFYPTVGLDVEGDFIADFDTGAFRTHLPEERWRPVFPLRAIRSLGSENSAHLGAKYKKFTKTVPVALHASNGKTDYRKMPIDFVVDWQTSPFVQVNKERSGLVGRDILRVFEAEVTLNGRDRTTKVKELKGHDGES